VIGFSNKFRPLKYSYDMTKDVLIVEGVQFSGHIFRFLSVGAKFEVELKNGVLEIVPVQEVV
jgi:hypothetical protein